MKTIRRKILLHNVKFCNRNQSGGRLHLVEGVGKIALADITLVEDPNEEDRNESEKVEKSECKQFL
jgi:hypothetical protein